MQTLGKILAGICAVLFVLTGVMALFLFNIEQKAFSAKTYKQAFDNQQVYEQMPSVLATALTASIAENRNSDPYLKAISQEEWEQTIASLLPPEELKALTDDALESVFDYLNGKTDSASISLLPFKRHMVGDSGVRAVKLMLVAQPECTTDQLTQMGLNLISGGGLILCNPSAELLDMFTPMIETQLQFMTIGIPDEITLIKGTQSDTPNDPRARLNSARAFMKLTPILPLLFLFGLTIFAVRSLAGWLKWWGVPFLITGGISFIVALIGSPALNLLIQRAIQNQRTNSVPPVLVSTLRETVSVVTGQILKPVVIEGFILAMLGFVMVVVAIYLAKRENAIAPATE